MTVIAKHVKDIVIQDPDTGGDVNVSIYKHQNGGMFGIDSSYIDQVCLGNEMINDPLADLDAFSRPVVLL